jgi:hypothetical protein
MGENAIRVELTCSFDCLIGTIDAPHRVLACQG